MTRADYTIPVLLAALAILLVLGLLLPKWLFLLTLALGKGLVVLGLMLLLRTGLVSFGQGLFYCLGAYAVGSLGQFLGIKDVMLLLLAGVLVGSVIALVLGLLMAKYRGIFFAMLSLAFSMITYGLLVKTAALGSTDGFNVTPPTLFRRPIGGEQHQYALFALACILVSVAVVLTHAYLRTPLGRLAPAIRDNEIRVEYMGASVRNAIHVKYVIAGALAGLGGALVAMTVGHIDPEMAYWTTSGEFIFVTILSGTGSVIAPFLGSFVFEIIRTYAYQYSPNTWQLVLGSALLLVIVFLPAGLWSAFTYLRRRS
ncbi:MAG TPA: branched-chain amino acid ABC transporter permease [Terriglobales bacterium]|nr:branched-chain amino acid ABC transporter permease [Terriglobales bacterium]